MKNFVFCWVMENTNTIALMSNGQKVPMVIVQFTIMEEVPNQYLAANGFPTREVMLIERGQMKSIAGALKVQMVEFTDEEIALYTMPSQEMKELFHKKYYEQGKNRYVFNSTVN